MTATGLSSRDEYRRERRSAGRDAADENLERGACGGICALCPNRDRHASARVLFAEAESAAPATL